VHFVKSFSDPATETRNSGTIGVRTVELIEAAKRSMREGKVIKV
jgi:hypothetical protein